MSSCLRTLTECCEEHQEHSGRTGSLAFQGPETHRSTVSAPKFLCVLAFVQKRYKGWLYVQLCSGGFVYVPGFF